MSGRTPAIGSAALTREDLRDRNTPRVNAVDAVFRVELFGRPPELRAELESLIARPPARSEFYRRYIRVNDAWRELANVAHLARIAAEPATEEAA